MQLAIKNGLHTLLHSPMVFMVAFLGTFIAGLCLGLMHAIGFDFATLPGDYGDVRFINCVLEHNWQWLIGNTDGVFQANFMYPEKNAITFSDHMLGHIPFYAPFRYFGLSPFHSLQGWLLVTILLNYLAGFIAFNYFFKNKWYALLAAYLFTFSLATLSQYVHIQMSARYLIPLVFMWLHKYLTGNNRRDLFITTLLLLYQFYSSFYLGYLLFFAALVFTLTFIALFRPSKDLLRKHFINLAPASGLFILLAFPLILPYAERSQTLGFVDYTSILPTIPNLFSYLRPFFGTTIWPLYHFNLEQNPVSWMHLLFPGGLVLLGLITVPFVWMKSKNKQLLLLGLSTFIIWLCFLQINDFSLLKFIRHIPGMGVVRIGTRIINLLVFFFPLIGIYSIQILLNKLTSAKQIVACITLLLLAFVDNHNNFNAYSKMTHSDNQTRVNDIANEVNQRFNPTQHKTFAVVMENGSDDDFNKYQIDAMLASYVLNIKTVNAYTSFAPADFNVFWGQKNKKALYHWLNANRIDTNAVLILNR